jgi:hypothetical protein
LFVKILCKKGIKKMKASSRMPAGLLWALFGMSVLLLFPFSSGARAVKGTAPPAKEEYTGTIIGVGGLMGGVSRPFTLTIEGYTSVSESLSYLQILDTQGQDGLQKAISKEKLGYFAVSGQLGRNLNFVRESAGDGGRRITILFERWLNMFEVRYGTRSEDYPFTYIELYIDKNGKGEGTLIPAARVNFDKKQQNQLNVENFGIYPARLAGVELRNKPQGPR